MCDELGKEFSVACSKLRHELRVKTGDGRLRDLEAWLDYDSKSVFLAALWSDDEASIAVRFLLSETMSRDEFDRQVVIKAAEASERSTHNDTVRLAA
jgi:hypothetical protein